MFKLPRPWHGMWQSHRETFGRGPMPWRGNMLIQLLACYVTAIVIADVHLIQRYPAQDCATARRWRAPWQGRTPGMVIRRIRIPQPGDSDSSGPSHGPGHAREILTWCHRMIIPMLDSDWAQIWRLTEWRVWWVIQESLCCFKAVDVFPPSQLEGGKVAHFRSMGMEKHPVTALRDGLWKKQ
jgi:hypothetical protein